MSDRVVFRDIDEEQLGALAAMLAQAVRTGGVIHLVGELGAGKTTFARALLRALGVGDRVKSPTYSLVESYRSGSLDAHHLDLYRIADAAELEWLGLADLCNATALFLIEWPERGANALPAPDLLISLAHAGTLRTLEARAPSSRGSAWLDAWRGSVGAITRERTSPVGPDS
jgi:tRNA threonylcarbamoyladenosine biosynthesis protein TsaE